MATLFVCADDPAPTDPAGCTAWVAESYEPSPFALDVAAAQSIAGAILLVWGVAYVFRVLARQVREY